MELYKKYRPTTFAEVAGQPAASSILTGFLKAKTLPHALLFCGPSGVGKTTAARILRGEIDCSPGDYREINAAESRGIDTVRDVAEEMNLCPLGGSARMFVFDEAHAWTKDAQQSALKILEDTPAHVYFVLATTDPHKLLPTIKTRCTQVEFRAIPKGSLVILLERVKEGESLDVEDSLLEQIASASDGSARKCLVLLEETLQIPAERRQAFVEGSRADGSARSIAQALFGDSSWQEVSKILQATQDDPEQIRHAVLGYARAVLLKNPRQGSRARLVIACFERNFFDSKQAGLAAACWDCMSPR